MGDWTGLDLIEANPKSPVPPLHHTVAAYLPACLPGDEEPARQPSPAQRVGWVDEECVRLARKRTSQVQPCNINGPPSPLTLCAASLYRAGAVT